MLEQATNDPLPHPQLTRIAVSEAAGECECEVRLPRWDKKHPNRTTTCGNQQGFLVSQPTSTYSRQPGRAGSPKGEGGKYDNVPYVIARTIRSNLHQEAAKLIGCTGMGNQCKRGQCFARAMQMFPGKGMDRIPTEVVLALLRH
ncbi:unnamed protein product [Pylaiella littoralis]